MPGENDVRIAQLADEAAMCLKTGLPLFAGYEYELIALVDDDERTLLELAHDVPEFAELMEVCLAYEGDDAWNLRNALGLIEPRR